MGDGDPRPLEPILVATVQEAHALAAHLLDPDRDRPVVVVTRAAGRPAAYVDVQALASDLSGLAEVWEMPTGALSWAFSDAMPPRTDVYGGASRVYAPGTEWIHDPYASPLTFVFSPADAPSAAAQLTADAMRAVRQSLSFESPAATSEVVAGVVSGVMAGRVIVRLSDGDLASIWTELVASGVEETRMVTKGMAVRGHLDHETRRLDVSGMRLDADVALAGYVPGSVVVGVVRYVDADVCVVEVYPDVQVEVASVDVVQASRSVDLRAVITEGEVVPARVVERGPDAEDWQLSLVAVGPDDRALIAPPILQGGPPWLAEPDAVELGAVPSPPESSTKPEAPAQPETPEPPAPAPEAPPPMRAAPAASGPVGEDVSHQLADVASEREQLLAELGRQRDAAKKMQRELQALKTAVRNETRKQASLEERARTLEAELGRSANDAALFTDPLEQLAFEVHLAWARTIPAGQKAERPLPRWTVGPEFLSTLEEVEGVSRSKVVDVIVEVLTGLAIDKAGREMHQLRTGSGGDDPPRVRADGATCWRVSLQVRTPSARRLHYWLLNDGSYELSSVRVHDDMRP